jgi:hypothetical protein
LCGWIGKALLYMMFWIMFSSFLCSSSYKLYVFSQLQRNLTAAYLCWAGWLEVYGMIVSVEVGFLYGYLPVLWGLVDSDVQVVYFVVSLCFCHKF